MLNKIMDCFNLWRYEDNDGNWEDEDGFFGSVTEGDFLLNIVTYKPQTMDILKISNHIYAISPENVGLF